MVVVVEDLAVVADAADLHEVVAAGVEHRGEAVEEADEVHRVVEYLKSQAPANYIEGILEGGVMDEDLANGEGGGSSDAESDPLYDQAVAVVLQNKRASISLVQRHLRIGYNRAARLLEQMEQSGLVSSMSGSGNREILLPKRDE